MSLGGEIARSYVTIGARTEEFQQKSQSVSQKLGGMGTKFMKTGAIMTAAVTVPVVAGFKQILSSASDAEELYSKFNTVFGEYADEVRGWADEHSNIWGRSSQDLQGYLAGSQSLLVGFGATRDEAQDLSKEIVTLAVDLASFNNLAEADAMKSLQSALMGNHEAAKALDVVINENTLSMAMLDLGYEGSFQSLSELEKINVRYHAVLMQSSDAVGDAERTSDSYANQVRRLQGDIKDMSAELGKHLLPIMTKVVEYFTKVIGKFSEMSPEGQKFVLIILGIVAAIGPLLIIIGAVMKAIAILGAVFGAISAPVLIVIGVIVALIAIFKHLWDTNEEFREGVIAIWEQIKEAAEEVWGAILETIEVVGEKITEFWSQHGEQIMAVLKPIWEQIKLVVETAIKLIKDTIKLILAIIRGDWEGAWEALSSILETVMNFMIQTVINIWDGVKEYLKLLWDVVSNIFNDALEGIKTKVSDKMADIKGKIEEIWNNVKEFFTSSWEAIRGINDGAVGQMFDKIVAVFTAIWGFIKTTWEAIKSYFRSIWEAIKALFRGDLDAMQTHLNAAFTGMQSFITNIWTSIKTFFQTIWDQLKQIVVTKAREIYRNAKQRFEDLWNYIKGIPSQALRWGRDILNNLWDGMKQAYNNLKSWFEDNVQGLLEKINPWARHSPSLIDNIRSGIKEIERLYSNLSLPDFNMQLNTGKFAAAGPVSSSTKITLDMRGLFEGANINMNSEQDAEILARKIYQLASGRARSEGTIL